MVQSRSARKMKSQGISVLLLSLFLSAGFVSSETLVPGAYLSPDICDKRVLYMVSPLMPRHVVLPESGCSVTVQFEVTADGKLKYPLSSNAVPYERQSEIASVESSSCNERYVSAVLRSLPKAQFATSEEGYSCTYRYNWGLEQ